MCINTSITSSKIEWPPTIICFQQSNLLLSPLSSTTEVPGKTLFDKGKVSFDGENKDGEQHTDKHHADKDNEILNRIDI